MKIIHIPWKKIAYLAQKVVWKVGEKFGNLEIFPMYTEFFFFVENDAKELPAETQFSNRQQTENCLEQFLHVTHS